MSEMLIVGISDYKIAKCPNVLVTYALGSCVGICIYDEIHKVGGLSHIMLPDSSVFVKKDNNRMKYADTAILDMVEEMKALGARRHNLTAKIAGGARMFETNNDKIGSIGDRNVDSVKSVLNEMRINIVAENTRENYGRTVFFDLNTGIMKIQSLSRNIKEL